MKYCTAFERWHLACKWWSRIYLVKYIIHEIRPVKTVEYLLWRERVLFGDPFGQTKTWKCHCSICVTKDGFQWLPKCSQDTEKQIISALAVVTENHERKYIKDILKTFNENLFGLNSYREAQIILINENKSLHRIT